ncbi:MAG TPA: hypothetical protein VFW44_09305 [Bryobacteraceae bacterium]|nr:hypothetical protein [Bryobacteraceae bacterium]
MTTLSRSTLILLGAAAALLAQWPAYPTPGLPKTADGKPNLSGPAPKTADGKPDLSGIWQNDRTVGGTVAARSSANPPKSNGDLLAIARRSPFWNLGASFPDGLPFTPWGAEVHRQRVADNSKDNPDAHCLPMGIMQFHNHGQPRKMIQTPQEIVILYEANSGLREIFTDGRPQPPKDSDPWWYGYSVGHWEGDTLVVNTSGFRDMGWLDVEGSPLTEGAHITERYRRPDYGHLQIEVTIDDPKAYTRPWTVTVHQHPLLNTELIEFVCQENEKDAPHLN